MIASGLTKLCQAARSAHMQRIGHGAGQLDGQSRRRAWGAAAAVAMGASLVSGCISVNAPDKPIVIELNINIKQEVVYRLQQDAGKTIDSNPGIF
jgi:hypothetical protein